MYKKILGIIGAVLLATVLVACAEKDRPMTQESNNPPEAQLKIVTTIFPQYDFARAVVKDRAQLTLLVKPGMEIHSYEPTPKDIERIKSCDVFIYNGGEGDIWVDKILKSMDVSHIKVVRMLDAVNPVEEATVEGMETEKEAEEGVLGEIKEVEYDEHIWTSPQNALKMTKAITDAVCDLDQKNEKLYRANSATYCKEIEKVDVEIREIVRGASRKLLVFGDRFPFRYFADEYGLKYRAAFNGCSTETEASAATMAYLIEVVKKEQIPVVFYIEQSNQNIARVISEHTGAKMLLLHSCHNLSPKAFDQGATYVSLMRENEKALEMGLK